MTISLEIDLVNKNYYTIRDSTLYTTIIRAQYVHFWKQLHLDPSFNVGIGLSGPSVGITISTIYESKHDNPRTNYFQFFFNR